MAAGKKGGGRSAAKATGNRKAAAKGHHVGFKKLSGELAAKGASDPKALAAAIGRKKYGNAGMAALAAKGRAKAKNARKSGK